MLHKKNILFSAAMGLLFLFLFSSCKKETPVAAPDPFYEVSINGFDVTFTNETKGASTYNWDFGSSIKLDDNTLSDWDTVGTNVVLAGAGSANFIKAKYDYDGNYLYVYFEQNTAKADGNIYDLYIDVDNDPSTGLLTGDIPNGAYEVLLEGTIFDGWLDPYYFGGSDQANFGGYASAGISDFWTVGNYKEAGGVLKFEFGIKRSKVKGLSSSQGLKIGVQVAANDWSATIGYSPDQGSNAFFLDMSE
jgi:hypothetical protein